jgi:cyclomaltodextrinase / maltogenic alpha-amylase / neopullulanase
LALRLEFRGGQLVYILLRRFACAALGAFGLLGPLGAAADATPNDSPPRDYSQAAARSSPAWVHEGVIYEIFPRAFSARGDFAGVTAQLDRLQQLGVNILWLMPIHPLGKLKGKGTLGSPYAVRDYYGIDPAYGTADDLHRLVSEAHKRHLKVIIDIVANHTAWDSVMMAHPDWYTHDAGGHIIPPNPDWTDVADLNYDNAGLRHYMQDMLVHWLKDFDLDGFRCDFAAGVPTDFWDAARDAMAKAKPDIVMLAEADSPELLVKAFDVDYAWKLYGTLAEVLQNGRPASSVRDQWLADAAQYPHGALRMRFADNHDQHRAIARFGEPAALAAAALMFTLDGVPMLYNGMEAGDTTESAAPALFEKLPVFWQSAELRPAYPRTFQQLIALRQAHAALRDGDLRWLQNSDEARVLTFARHDAGESIVVAINLSALPFVGVTDSGGGHFRDITPGSSAGEASLPALSLGPWEFRVFLRTQAP